MKFMNMHEFWTNGYVQEANRQFFHPHGLAIVVDINERTKELEIVGIEDYRDEQEGILFTQWFLPGDEQKRVTVHEEFMRHHEARRRVLGGSAIQPVGFIPEEL